MKLIALRDFTNVKGLGLKVKDQQHDNHIHEGAEFEIGTSATLKELEEADPAKARTVAQLIYAGCVGDATDAAVVKRVKENAAARKKREEAEAAASKKADLSAVGAAVVTAVTEKTDKK